MTIRLSSAPTTFCGCGWLGKQFVQQFQVKNALGTTRTQDNANSLSALHVSPLIFSLGDDESQLCKQSRGRSVILNIPPGRKKTVPTRFVENMKNLAARVLEGGCKKLLFISTTSVYGDTQGEIWLGTALNPNTSSGEAHAKIEEFLREKKSGRLCILRLSGLVGPDRHPVNSLADRDLTKGEQAVNLVHIHDVNRAIYALVTREGNLPDSVNLCSAEHPRRDEYYTWCANKCRLTAPRFTETAEDGVSGKQINSYQSWESLGLSPLFNSPYDMLE